MKHVYQCEICKATYPTEDLAQECEAWKPEPKFTKGQTVYFDTRYNGEASSLIVDLELRGEEYFRYGMNREDESLDDGESVHQYVRKHFKPHYWAYKISDQFQFGKDFYSEWITESSARSEGRLTP